MHINPDHYLQTQQGRIWTKERNQIAWKRCFEDYLSELRDDAKVQIVYLLIGCQGSGKTHWAAIKNKEESHNIIFDAILVQKSERKYLLRLAHIYKKTCIAIYFTTTLKECLYRNSCRNLDERADEQALTNVFMCVEKPTLDEGFSSIVQV